MQDEWASWVKPTHVRDSRTDLGVLNWGHCWLVCWSCKFVSPLSMQFLFCKISIRVLSFHDFYSVMLVNCSVKIHGPRTILNSSGQSGHPCLVPNLGWNASNFPPFNIMLVIGLLNIALCWQCSFYSQFVKVSIMKGHFIECFLFIYWSNHMFFYLSIC